MQLQLFRWLPVNHNQKHHFEKCEVICNTSREHWQHIALQYIYTFTICFQLVQALVVIGMTLMSQFPSNGLYPHNDKCYQW